MNIGRLITTAGLAIVLAGLGACTTIGSPPQLDYRPTMPPQPVLPPATSGTIYQPARGLSLFEDVKARRIGDTLVSPGEPIEALLDRVDLAMYKAKRDGKNRVRAVPAPSVLLG